MIIRLYSLFYNWNQGIGSSLKGSKNTDTTTAFKQSKKLNFSPALLLFLRL